MPRPVLLLARAAGSPLAHAAVLVGVCWLVFWRRLGAGAFTSSEGHRAIPAWEMLERGEYLLPRLFGAVYLRKPQGMTWAIAGSSAAFGQGEWAARAVSAAAATLSVLIAWAWARRWFGRPWAITAGLAQALTPWFWQASRAAEIEPLHQLCVQLGVLLLISAIVPPAGARARSSPGLGALAGLAVTGACLVKGPAGAPVFGAAVLAACVTARSVRPLRAPGLWVGAAVAASVVGLVAWRTVRALAHADAPVVLQTPGHFLWNADEVPRILALAPVAILLGLPASAGVIGALLRAGRSGAAPGVAASREDRLALTLAITAVTALAVETLAGVGNPRYAMPAFSFAAVLVPYALRGLPGPGRVERWVHPATLARPGVLAAGLLVASQVYIGVEERRRERHGGSAAGAALADVLPDGAVLCADGLVDARPDVLHAARESAAAKGRSIDIRWTPIDPDDPGAWFRRWHAALAGRQTFLALRQDDDGVEQEMFRRAGLLDHLEPVGPDEIVVSQYRFGVFRVREGRDDGGGRLGESGRGVPPPG